MNIKIRWRGTTEYITLNFTGSGNLGQVTMTSELWNDGTVVRYRTESEFERKGKVGWKLTLSYIPAMNPDLPDGARFGTSVIMPKADAAEGTAKWKDKFDASYDYTATWNVLDGTFITTKQITTKMVRQVERQQQDFRNLLKGVYGECAITKEQTLAALEAAHIVPARDSGAENIQNGLLLRADLHRLYDAGEFIINTDGEIVIPDDSTLSLGYKKLLQTGSIPERVRKNVVEALKYKLASEDRSGPVTLMRGLGKKGTT